MPVSWPFFANMKTFKLFFLSKTSRDASQSRVVSRLQFGCANIASTINKDNFLNIKL